MGFPYIAGIPTGAEKVTSSAGNDNKLGFMSQTADGRFFRYMKNSTVALTAGVLVQGPAVNSSNDAALPIAAAISSGGFSVTTTVQATVTKDQFKDGFLTVDTDPGIGLYKIAANTAAASGATVTVTLDENDPLRVALSTVTKIGLRENPYKNVIVAPTTVTGPLLGTTPTAVPASHYFWAQVEGFGIAVTDDAPAVNTGLIFGATSAGNLNSRSSALNDIPEITVAHGVDAGAGADKANFVRIKLG